MIYGLGEASIGLIRMEIVFRATLAIIAERSISIQTNKVISSKVFEPIIVCQLKSIQTNKVCQLKSLQTIEKFFISDLTNC